MRALLRVFFCLAVLSVAFGPASTSAQAEEFGIAAKRPVFGGACKACPWGILGFVVKDALKPYGYDVVNCWVCWSTFGPREMADKTKPVMPPGSDQPSNVMYVEPPPDAILDFSATGESFLNDAWNGVGPYANDHKVRHNYRVIAVVQQPTYLTAAVTVKSGIKSLAEIKDRKEPTWITTSGVGALEVVLPYYGITEEGLKAKGGGILHTQDRMKRASADVFIGMAILANTPEQRMWSEIAQLNDLNYLDLDEGLLNKLAAMPGYTRRTMPMAMMRGQDRPIQTVVRQSQVIYGRDDMPDDFAYLLAKALDEHQDLFRYQAEPIYYDPQLVAKTEIVPMHPGALKYYRERGYIK